MQADAIRFYHDIMYEPGPLNSICDVPGIRVGHAEHTQLTTGVTVIVPDNPAIAAVDQRGGGTGSRDTAVLAAGSTVQHVHAITLSGGSAYGLDAAGGVMHGLRLAKRGFAVGDEIVPIVPSAIIFDLLVGGPKTWSHPPYWSLGLSAFEAADKTSGMGNVGAGLGATAGSIKGGLGTASYRTDAFTVGALAIANPVGSTVMPGTNTFWAWDLEQGDELGGQHPPKSRPAEHVHAASPVPLANTTLVVVATDAALTPDDARRIAVMAQDGLARAIRPAHGPLDGDTVFAISTGQSNDRLGLDTITLIGSLAADCAARAIMLGVYHAESLHGIQSYRAGMRTTGR